MSQKNMCPICCEPFKLGEVVTKYTTWGKEGPGLDRFGHYDCVVDLSRTERNRSRPSSDDASV
ncbi:hypothetical protein [Burkholderia gladioli]|uniref:hypothetical protein n=1 Tax=Burkholderia gladioli TaxID=28095 RepID=UPI0016404B29|nr:hypothetical protein [Burkholderia gladioli]